MEATYRIIDVNLNRSKEGLRVCEEVIRFVYEDPKVTSQLKKVRRQISETAKRLPVDIEVLIDSRDSEDDKGNVWDKTKRKDIQELFLANMQRVKEALRVLEEFSKTLNVKSSNEFRELRFQVYTLEKSIIKRMQAV